MKLTNSEKFDCSVLVNVCFALVFVVDLNLLDWSSQNILAVCLGASVYLWNASTGDIQQLMEMEGNDEYVSSISWMNEGNHLAVGTSTTEVQVSALHLFSAGVFFQCNRICVLGFSIFS